MMKEMASSWVLLILSVLALSGFGMGKVVLMGKNVTMTFDDMEASFAPDLEGSGICGPLYVADPLDACSPLINKVDNQGPGKKVPFVLIIRGDCTFENKVRRAQAAGYKAAIIYDDVDGNLVSMSGDGAGIQIHSVFVSQATGKILTKYSGVEDIQLCILPDFENSAWTIMAIAFISLLTVAAFLATCYFVQSHRIRRESPPGSPERECQGMSARHLKAMPCMKYKAVIEEDSSTSSTCAICLEDYRIAENVRKLPCSHKFHARCIDAWLLSWRTFCPVCKRDARTSTGEPPASERTPLLSPNPSLFASFSARSSVSSTSAILIRPPSYRSSRTNSHLNSSSVPRASYISTPFHINSVPSTSYMQNSLQSSLLSASRSSIDLRNAYHQRSPASNIISPYSIAFPSVSPLNTTRCMSPYIPSPVNGSSYVGSSSRQQNPLDVSESATTFSPFSSAQSLPEC